MPFPNEHACRLKDPNKYEKFARQSRKSSNGKSYDVIFGIWTEGTERKSEEQTYRYPKKSWTESEARKHCQEHNGKFEVATKGQEMCDDCIMDLKDIIPKDGER